MVNYHRLLGGDLLNLNNPHIDYYENLANKMYPKKYQKLLPYIEQICSREDHPYNYNMHPFPSEEKIKEMVDEVYVRFHEENDMNKENQKEKTRHHPHHHGHHHHHKKDDFLNDVIKILILKELLDRRCKRGHWWC